MSSQCPVCAAPIAADFGFVECASCGAQLLVHADGHVEAQGAHVPEAPDEAVAAVTPDEGSNVGFHFGSAPREIEFPALPEDAIPPAIPEIEHAHESAELPPPEPDPIEDLPAPDAYQEEEPESEAEAMPDVNEAFDFGHQGEASGDPVPLSTPAAGAARPSAGDGEATRVYVPGGSDGADSPDLSDIARFGNSDLSGAREGTLRYTLLIEGIDTADVREAFREALTDRKLMWDTDQILRSIRQGQVRIPGVTAVKAFMLISRLRSLPVRVKWEQYAVHQA